MVLTILAIHIMILAMHNTGRATGVVNQVRVRLWVAVYSDGKARQGWVWLWILRCTQGCYAVIGDLRGGNLGILVS
jgi:hypothetical protein